MGYDYKCGCRQSMGHWFLCVKHMQIIEDEENEIRKDMQLGLKEKN